MDGYRQPRTAPLASLPVLAPAPYVKPWVAGDDCTECVPGDHCLYCCPCVDCGGDRAEEA